MDEEIYSESSLNHYENIRFLAEEMAKRKAKIDNDNKSEEKSQEENEKDDKEKEENEKDDKEKEENEKDDKEKDNIENNDKEKDNGDFQKIIFFQSTKHKSQIFSDFSNNKMMRHFFFNKAASRDNFDFLGSFYKNKRNNRRQSSILPKNMKKKIGFKKVGNRSSLQTQKNKNSVGKELEENSEEKNNSTFIEVNKEKVENLTDNEEDYYNEDGIENNKKNNNNNLGGNYEIKYMKPNKIKKLYDKENSEINEQNNNNNTKINNKMKLIKKKHSDKARYFFDKEMKLLNLRNIKIEKKRKNLEKQNNYDFQPNLDKNSINLVKDKYIPIQDKALELHQYHLARIENSQDKKRNKKEEEKKKEIEEVENYRKMKKKIFNKSKWEEFVKQENFWNEEKTKATKLLKDKINNQINYQPKIDKNSKIIYEKLKEKNKNANYNNKNDNIFIELYNEQEKYDNKLEIKRQESTPTFKPFINKYNKLNRSQKISKCLNIIDNSYIDINSKNDKRKKNKVKNFNSLLNDYKNIYNIIKYNNLNNKKINLKLINNSRLAVNTSLKSSKEPKFNISISKNFNITKKDKKNKTNSYENIIKYEYDISNSNNKKNSSKKNVKKNKYNKKDKNSFSFMKEYKHKKKSYNYLFNDNYKDKNRNNLKKYLFNLEFERKKKLREESIYNEIKNISYKKNEEKVLEDEDLIYNLNIRDNTSNFLRENIVLSSKKYKDFFKIKN